MGGWLRQLAAAGPCAPSRSNLPRLSPFPSRLHAPQDEFSANSSLDGRPILSRLEEREDSQVVLAAEADDAAGPAPAAYQPGFLGKTVPDGSPLGGGLPLDASPGMVSMEITQPVLAAAGQPEFGYGEEEEGEAQLQDEQLGWAASAAHGEVTAGLPALGALAEEDAYEEELAQQQQQQQQAAGAWAAAAGAGGGTGGLGNVTLNNITGGIPGLSSLIAEDEAEGAGLAEPPAEEVTAGMDLTVAAGGPAWCIGWGEQLLALAAWLGPHCLGGGSAAVSHSHQPCHLHSLHPLLPCAARWGCCCCTQSAFVHRAHRASAGGRGAAACGSRGAAAAGGGGGAGRARRARGSSGSRACARAGGSRPAQQRRKPLPAARGAGQQVGLCAGRGGYHGHQPGAARWVWGGSPTVPASSGGGRAGQGHTWRPLGVAACWGRKAERLPEHVGSSLAAEPPHLQAA